MLDNVQLLLFFYKATPKSVFAKCLCAAERQERAFLKGRRFKSLMNVLHNDCVRQKLADSYQDTGVERGKIPMFFLLKCLEIKSWDDSGSGWLAKVLSAVRRFSLEKDSAYRAFVKEQHCLKENKRQTLQSNVCIERETKHWTLTLRNKQMVKGAARGPVQTTENRSAPRLSLPITSLMLFPGSAALN